MRLNWVTTTALILVMVGALNWGFVGAFHFDLVAALFGPMSLVSRIVYVVIGLSALCVFWHWISTRNDASAIDPRPIDTRSD